VTDKKAYTIRTVQGQPQTAQKEFCLQCKKRVNLADGFALEVTEDDALSGIYTKAPAAPSGGTLTQEFEELRPRTFGL
jgi:hypothetical protein